MYNKDSAPVKQKLYGFLYKYYYSYEDILYTNNASKEGEMKRFIPILAMAVITIMAASSCSVDTPVQAVQAEKDSPEYLYEVLSPWADVDPIPLRGISPRLDTLAGKKIGLFANFKRAAVPIANEVDKRLKDVFPDIETILFHSTAPNVDESETARKEEFAKWAKSVDAVVGVVGD
jgi:hypothetical protein